MNSKQKKPTTKKEKRQVVLISEGPRKPLEESEEDEAIIESMQTKIKKMKKQKQKKKTDNSVHKSIQERKSEDRQPMVRKISMPRIRMRSNYIEMIDPNLVQDEPTPMTSFRPVIQHHRIVVNPKSTTCLVLPYRFHI